MKLFGLVLLCTIGISMDQIVKVTILAISQLLGSILESFRVCELLLYKNDKKIAITTRFSGQDS